MAKFISWFVLSSKNPQKVALTMKGLFGFFVLLGFANAADAELAENAVMEIVIFSGQILTAGVTVWGFLRKIYLTFKE